MFLAQRRKEIGRDNMRGEGRRGMDITTQNKMFIIVYVRGIVILYHGMRLPLFPDLLCEHSRSS